MPKFSTLRIRCGAFRVTVISRKIKWRRSWKNRKRPCKIDQRMGPCFMLKGCQGQSQRWVHLVIKREVLLDMQAPIQDYPTLAGWIFRFKNQSRSCKEVKDLLEWMRQLHLSLLLIVFSQKVRREAFLLPKLLWVKQVEAQCQIFILTRISKRWMQQLRG